MSQPPELPANLRVEAPVVLPTSESQEMVLVRRSELHTLKRGIERALTNPVAAASGWAFTWLGFGGGAGVATVALLAVEGDEIKPGILAGLIAATVAGLFLAVFCHWIDKKRRETEKTAKDDLCREIDDLDQRAPTKLEGQSGSA